MAYTLSMNNANQALDVTETYTTCGAVRGCCGHTHRTLEAAVRCLQDDRRGCRTQGGYSDRSVTYADGSALAEADHERVEDLLWS